MEPEQLHGGVMNFRQEQRNKSFPAESVVRVGTPVVCVYPMGIDRKAECLPVKAIYCCPGTLENVLLLTSDATKLRMLQRQEY